MTCAELPEHDTDPGLEVFLHALAASLKEVLDSFYFSFKLLELIVLLLILHLEPICLRLKLLFFRCLEYLPRSIHKSSHCVLFSNLFYLVGKSFNFVPTFIDIVA